MDSYRILGCAEECSDGRDNESGWTTYIASSIQQSHHHHNRDSDQHHITNRQADYKKDSYCEDDDNQSDDSMASDASSGPSHQVFPCKNDEKTLGTRSSKHADIKHSSRDRLYKHKQREETFTRTKIEKQESVIEANSATSHIQGGAKVRKT